MTKEIILAVIVFASIGAIIWAFVRSGKNSTSTSPASQAERDRAATAATIITAGTVSPLSAGILAASVARKEQTKK